VIPRAWKAEFSRSYGIHRRVVHAIGRISRGEVVISVITLVQVRDCNFFGSVAPSVLTDRGASRAGSGAGFSEPRVLVLGVLARLLAPSGRHALWVRELGHRFLTLASMRLARIR
jgi:hypothetical protein